MPLRVTQVCVFVPSLVRLGACWHVQSALRSHVYPRPQSVTPSTRCRSGTPALFQRGKVIRLQREQVVTAYFSLAPPFPAEESPFAVAEVKGQPGKGCSLRARDIPAFLGGLNWSQRGLSLEINGPPCYLNTRWVQQRGEGHDSGAADGERHNNENKEIKAPVSSFIVESFSFWLDESLNDLNPHKILRFSPHRVFLNILHCQLSSERSRWIIHCDPLVSPYRPKQAKSWTLTVSIEFREGS